jgi:hypothetical protein
MQEVALGVNIAWLGHSEMNQYCLISTSYIWHFRRFPSLVSYAQPRKYRMKLQSSYVQEDCPLANVHFKEERRAFLKC